jgi:hypothetical protein
METIVPGLLITQLVLSIIKILLDLNDRRKK